MDKKTEHRVDKVVIGIIVLALLVFIGNTLIRNSKNIREAETQAITEVTETEKISMFEVVEDHYNYTIVYDVETGVMYAVSNGSNNKGTFTMLVNSDGSPKIYNK